VTPEQEEQVRRALAATARAEGDPALPPEVAARLDRVLNELEAPRVAAAERQDGTAAPADELASRRRRRLPDLLVAAAAVSVIAVTGGAVATGGFGLGGSSSSTTAGSASQGSDSPRTPAPQGLGTDTGPGAGADSRLPRTAAGDGRVAGSTAASPGGEAAGPAGPRLPRLRTATLRRDVRRLLPVPSVPTGTDPSADAACPGPAPRTGERRIAVRLDGRAATLVLGAPADGTRTARVYACGETGTPSATVRVRAR
jgi:hypothetical protein